MGLTGGPRAPWFVPATVAAAAWRGLGDVQECVSEPSRGDSEMGCLEVRAVPSSSFLPACNYSVIAQSGIVGVDVYNIGYCARPWW